MSSGKRRPHYGFNKSIIRNGVVVILDKNGKIREYLDPKTKEVIKK